MPACVGVELQIPLEVGVLQVQVQVVYSSGLSLTEVRLEVEQHLNLERHGHALNLN